MCGLAGFIKIDPDAPTLSGAAKYKLYSGGITTTEDFLNTMARMTDRRGGDGTGVTLVANYEFSGHTKTKVDHLQTTYWKSLSRFTTWAGAATNTVASAIDTAQCCVVHTRKGSSGGNTLETTHPMADENREIIMSHNGTLSNWEEEFDGKPPISDTAAMVAMMKDKGAKHMFETLQGPMTCVWVESSKELLHIHRSKDRPLYLGEYQGYLFFASERWMLYAGIDVNGGNLDDLKITEFPVNTHKTWDIATGKEVSSVEYTPARVIVRTTSYVGGRYDDFHWPNRNRNQGNLVRHRLPSADRRIIKTPGVCDLTNGDWVLAEPYLTTTRPSNVKTVHNTTKLISMADHCHPLMDDLVNEPIDISTFVVPIELADSLISNADHLSILLKAHGLYHVQARSVNFQQGLNTVIRGALPVLKLDYSTTKEQWESVHKLLQEMLSFQESIKEADSKVPNINDNDDWAVDGGMSVRDVYDEAIEVVEALISEDDQLISDMFLWGQSGYIPKESWMHPSYKLLYHAGDAAAFAYDMNNPQGEG